MANNGCENIGSMNKDQLIEAIINYSGKFKMDFTEEYLKDLSCSKLRHILEAAMRYN
jgi:hypothetical protein